MCKKLLKSVNFWQSYSKKYNGGRFWGTQGSCEDRLSRGKWVWTTCLQSLRSRIMIGGGTRERLIVRSMPYHCATFVCWPLCAFIKKFHLLLLFCSVLLPSSIRGLTTPSTYFLHLSLYSVILNDSSTWSPVHVLMLSIQAMRGLPRLPRALRRVSSLFLGVQLS